MKIHELLDSPSKWTKGHYARDKDGENVAPRSVMACCWCLAGAVLKCYEFEARGEVSRKISDAVRERKGEGYVSWNDDRATRYEEVFDLVKKLDV